MKRWFAGLLALLLLFSGAAGLAEEPGMSTADIQKTVTSQEGETTGTLAENLEFLVRFIQNEQVRSLLKMDDFRDVAVDIVWEALVWMVENRPVTMKILTEVGVGEADRNCVEKLWDACNRISAAVEEYKASEDGQRLAAEYEALRTDPDFRESLENMRDMLTSENITELSGAVWSALEESTGDFKEDGELTREALKREMSQTSFVGSLLMELLGVLQQSKWASVSLPKLLRNEPFWVFVLHLTNGNEALDSLIQGELRALSEDPEMRSFVDRTLEALFTLGSQIEQSVAPDVQNAENTENGQEPIESTVEGASP